MPGTGGPEAPATPRGSTLSWGDALTHYYVYVDDSGHPEYSFALGAVLVPTPQWNEVLDRLIAFRRRLRDSHGFPARAELHAKDFAPGTGPWLALPKVRARTRWGLYKAALRELHAMAPVVRAVGIVVPDLHDPRLHADARLEAWTILLQRLERFCTLNDATCQLVVDRGDEATIRKLAREKRRWAPTPSAFAGFLERPFDRLVEDPWFRDSTSTYLGQWADLVAYAGWRTARPRDDIPPNLWRALGAARLHEANEFERQRRGSPEEPGLIVWPGRRLPR
jgi:hypothetical protein